MRPILTLSTLALITTFIGTSFAEEDLSLTIYGGNRALIEDKRDINYKSGQSRVELPNVSSQINAQTVTFEADGVSIIEQNFDFDLLSPDKLMEKAVGQTVQIVRINPATGKETKERAKVLATNRGVVVEIDGRIEVLRDDNLPTRVIFDRVPQNLRAKPTLSVEVDSAKAGTRETTLTYLSNGLSWRADYVALFDEEEGQMAFQGWSTLTNGTDTTFEDAAVQLVAGDVNQNNNRPSNSRRGIKSAGTEAGDVERIGDNYLYRLPSRTTIASKQTKQVGIIDSDKVKARKAYEYYATALHSHPQPQNVDVRIAFANSKASGLGSPLPRGTIRVYAKDSADRAQFIGEDNIDHVPGGSDMSLKIGSAFDVTVQSTLVERKNINKRVTDSVIKYKIKNARPTAETVTIRQFVNEGYLDTEILEESEKHRRPQAEQYVWDVKVPAEGETVLEFKLREKRRWW